MSTLQIAAILFALAAVGGIVLATIRMKGANPPLGLAAIHGTAAAAGLVTLAIAVLGPGLSGLPLWSLIVFVIAALGGFVMLATHLKGKLIPIGLVGIHATAAVVAFVMLLIAAFG
jgi:hypothetical protein